MTADLTERIAELGRIVLRGDIAAVVERLDQCGHERRLELAASQADDRIVRLVDDFGAPAVIEAIGIAAARLRRRARGGQS